MNRPAGSLNKKYVTVYYAKKLVSIVSVSFEKKKLKKKTNVGKKKKLNITTTSFNAVNVKSNSVEFGRC